MCNRACAHNELLVVVRHTPHAHPGTGGRGAGGGGGGGTDSGHGTSNEKIEIRVSKVSKCDDYFY